jgi:hypothetical protein
MKFSIVMTAPRSTSFSSFNLHKPLVNPHVGLKCDAITQTRITSHKTDMLEKYNESIRWTSKGFMCDGVPFSRDEINMLFRNIEKHLVFRVKFAIVEDTGDSPISTGGSGKHYCSRCDRNFSKIGHLARHLDTVHSKSRFSCVKCQSTFSRADSLRLHLLKCMDGTQFI